MIISTNIHFTSTFPYLQTTKNLFISIFIARNRQLKLLSTQIITYVDLFDLFTLSSKLCFVAIQCTDFCKSLFMSNNWLTCKSSSSRTTSEQLKDHVLGLACELPLHSYLLLDKEIKSWFINCLSSCCLKLPHEFYT